VRRRCETRVDFEVVSCLNSYFEGERGFDTPNDCCQVINVKALQWQIVALLWLTSPSASFRVVTLRS
jgi:hypothetical protein